MFSSWVRATRMAIQQLYSTNKMEPDSFLLRRVATVKGVILKILSLIRQCGESKMKPLKTKLYVNFVCV